MICKVAKRFNAFGKNLAIGDVVDSGGWRNERNLMEHRYLVATNAELTPDPLSTAVPSKPSNPTKAVRKRRKKSAKAARGEI